MTRLPDIDPAGSPRVAMTNPRVEHNNPYVPRMGVPAKRYANIVPGGVPPARGQHSKTRPPGAAVDQSAPLRPEPPRGAPSGSMSARMHGEYIKEQERSKSASASMVSPRISQDAQHENALNDARTHLLAHKRLERLHDSYQTAFSRETLLSEGYDKELVSLREHMAKIATSQPVDRAVSEHNAQLRKRSKLARRVSGFEEKLNELDTYNGKLVETISALRKQNEPHRNAEKRVTQALEKLAIDMATQKAACHKSLDDRERMVDLLRHVQQDADRDETDFHNQMLHLKQDAEEMDQSNKHAESVLAQATELTKRKEFNAVHAKRKEQERLQVTYAYLKSQLDGVDNDFRELQRIVGVHFQPSHPESLEQIIQKFVEKEGQVVSLQRYFSLQSDQIETLSSQLQTLSREADAAQSAKQQADNVAAAKASSRGRHAPWEGPMLDELQMGFDKACALLEAMFLHAGCDTMNAQGLSLVTKGCSMSTIHDFMSCIAQRIDLLSSSAYTIREAATTHRNASARKGTAEAIDSFLRPRGPSTASAAAGGGAAAGGSTDAAADGAALLTSGDVKRTFNKEDLPSMTDHGPEDFADDSAGPSRGRGREGKKGAIDREKRDSAIAAWVNRQELVRGAKTARPTIREYYEPDQPQRTIYPPASAR